MTDDRVRRRLEDLARFVDEAAYVVSKGRDAYLAATPEGALLRTPASAS